MTDIRKFFGGGGSGGGGSGGSVNNHRNSNGGATAKPSNTTSKRAQPLSSSAPSKRPPSKKRKTSTTSAYFDVEGHDDDDDEDDEFVVKARRPSTKPKSAAPPPPPPPPTAADDDADDFVPIKKDRKSRVLIDDDDAVADEDDDAEAVALDVGDDDDIDVEYDDEERPRKRSKTAANKTAKSHKLKPAPASITAKPPAQSPPPSTSAVKAESAKSASHSSRGGIVDESSVWAMASSDTPVSRISTVRPPTSSGPSPRDKAVPIAPADFFNQTHRQSGGGLKPTQSDDDFARRLDREEKAERKRKDDESYALAIRLQEEENAKSRSANTAPIDVDDDGDDVQFVSANKTPKTPPKPRVTASSSTPKVVTPKTSASSKASKTPPQPKAEPTMGTDTAAEFDPYDSSDKKKKGAPSWILAKQHRAAPPKLEGLKAIPDGAPGCLKGLTFVLTGVLESLDRDTAKDLIVKYGGKVTGGVSGKTDYLVAGDDAGESKRAKATEKGTKVIDENGLFALISSKPAQSTEVQMKPAKAGNKETAAMRAAKSVVSNVDSNSAVLRVHGQSAASSADMLWVDKHRPMKMADIVGNEGVMNKIKEWIMSFDAKLSDPKSVRAILISGAPGSGKSTAATVVARACGYEPIEFNASDARNRGTIESVIGNVAGIHSIGEYFAAADSSSIASHKAVIIMDEVDGMGGNADRGGMQSLIAVIKKTKKPIICICNDASSVKIRSLKNYCTALVWRRPTLLQIEPRIAAIARAEGLSIDSPTIAKLVESTQGDIRQIINFLQMFRKTHRSINYDQAKTTMAAAAKDFDQNTFSVVPSLFRPVDRHSAAQWINERINLYFVDAGLMPLFVEDQYLHGRPTVDADSRMAPVRQIEVFSSAADMISDGDVLSAAFRTDSVDFSYMPEHAVISTVAPAFFVGPISGGLLGFPTWMGQNSKRTKNFRLLREIGQAMSIDVGGAHTDSLILDYLPLIRIKLIEPLRRDESDRVSPLIATLDEFGLTRDDIEVIMELTDVVKPEAEARDDNGQFTAQIKSSLTRELKKGAHIRKVTRTGAEKDAGVSRGPAVRIAVDGLEEEDETAVEEDDADDDDADDIKKDKLITGGTSKTSTSTSSRVSAAKGSRGGGRGGANRGRGKGAPKASTRGRGRGGGGGGSAGRGAKSAATTKRKRARDDDDDDNDMADFIDDDDDD